MKAALAVAGCLLAALAVGATGGSALQGLQALPDPVVCETGCTLSGHAGGYLPPVAVVRDGAAVTWASLDSTHINQDGTFPLENDPACFLVTYSSTTPSAPVTFHVGPAGVSATVGVETKDCVSAEPVPEGFVLNYWCVLHPTMRGALVLVA